MQYNNLSLDFIFLFSLVFQGYGDHVGWEVYTADFDTIFSGHVEGGTADAAADVQHFFTRFQVQLFTKFL